MKLNYLYFDENKHFFNFRGVLNNFEYLWYAINKDHPMVDPLLVDPLIPMTTLSNNEGVNDLGTILFFLTQR